MMLDRPQSKPYKLLVYWEVYTDNNTYRLTEKEVDALMMAESKGARLIRFHSSIINIAFIKEIKRKEKRVYEDEFNRVSEDEKKYLVETTDKLLP